MPTTPVRQPGSGLGYIPLLVFLFLLFSRICDLVLGSLHIPLISSVLAMIFALLGGRLLVGLSHPVSMLLAAYTIWLTLSIPFAVWPGGSFGVVTDDWYKAFLAYLLVVTLIRTYEEAARGVRVVAYALALLCLLALTVGKRIEGRLLLPQGYFSNPNELGMAMLAGIFLAWFLAHDPQIAARRRILGAAMLAPMLYVLLETGSRAGLLCVGFVLPLLFCQYSARGKIKFLVGLTLIGAISVAIVPTRMMQRFSTFFQASSSAEDQVAQEEAVGSSEQRMYLLRTSLLMTVRNPLLGVGPGNFVVVDAESAKQTGITAGWAGTHNTYTQISSEAGVPALVFFLGAIVTCWRRLTRARKLNAAGTHAKKQEIDVLCGALKLTLAVFSFQFFFIHMAYSALFPAMAGIIVAVTRAVETEVSKASKPASGTVSSKVSSPTVVHPAFARRPAVS